MLFIRKSKSFQFGLTLLEVMISLAIIMVGLTILVSLGISSFRAALLNKDRIVASNLASEGVEAVRYIRCRTGWTNFSLNYPGVVGDGNYRLDYDYSLNPDSWSLNDNPGGDPWEVTNPSGFNNFKRNILIEDTGASSRRVTSTVTWTTKGFPEQTVTAVLELTE